MTETKTPLERETLEETKNWMLTTSTQTKTLMVIKIIKLVNLVVIIINKQKSH